jgi:hypothetical protein
LVAVIFSAPFSKGKKIAAAPTPTSGVAKAVGSERKLLEEEMEYVPRTFRLSEADQVRG